MPGIHEDTLIALDLETTGVSAKTDHIIEVGAVKFKGGEQVDTFSALVNPQRKLSSFIVGLTGITQEKVDAASDWDDVKSDVEKLALAIIDVMEVAQTNGVQCWLNYGALLGVVRENRLLPWNNDAQLCCWYETNISYKFKRITEELNKMGYHAIYYSTIGAISIRQKGVAVHITCYWQDGEYAVRPHESPSDFGYAPYTAIIFYWLATLMGAYPGGLAPIGICPDDNTIEAIQHKKHKIFAQMWHPEREKTFGMADIERVRGLFS